MRHSGENKVLSFESKIGAVLFPLGFYGSELAVAVSGGADSTALLVACSRLRERGGFALRCVFVDHGIRPAAELDGDRYAVESLCRSLDVPFLRIPPPLVPIADRARETGRGIEDAARAFRLGALIRAARSFGAAGILLGHNLNDVRENSLMRALRGAGPIGLAGMTAVRGRFIRPMLNIERSEIESYLGSLGIAYRTDSTNSDVSYLRNRIRHRLVPLLDSEFPFWKGGIDSFARIQGRTADLVSAEARRRVRWIWTDRLRMGLRTDAAGFYDVLPIVREEAVLRAVDRLLYEEKKRRKVDSLPSPDRNRPRPPSRDSVSRFCDGGAVSADLGGTRVRSGGGSVFVELTLEEGMERGYAFTVSVPGPIPIPGNRFRAYASELGSVPDSAVSIGVEFPCVVRSPVSMDSLAVEPGRGRSLSDLAAGLRRRLPGVSACAVVQDAEGIAAVLFDGPSGSEVMVAESRKPSETYYAQAVFFSIL